MSITIVHDVISANFAKAPSGMLAGYTTGSPDIRWTPQMWQARPGSIRIDQDVNASDGTADVIDVEGGAATYADVGPWANKALASYRAGTRPGQRAPLVYMSASNITPVCNELLRAGLANGSVGLFVANWNLSQGAAVAQVIAASGPFPIHGIQFADQGAFDIDIFSDTWLNDVSHKHEPAAAPSVWGITAGLVKPSDLTVNWMHTPGVSEWHTRLTGPGRNSDPGTDGVPQAVYTGLHGGQLYHFSVVSLVGGKETGVVGARAFRTPVK